MSFRATIAVLLVIALGLVGWRLLGFEAAAPHTDEQTSTPAGSDYYMRGATIYQMNKQGRLAYRSTVAESLHYPDDSARLRTIHVHYKTGTHSFWTLQAARGRIPAGSRDLHLTGGVTLHHPKPEGQTVVVQTSNAWVRPQDNAIETQAHVTAHSPGKVVEADGLHIDLDNDEMDLHHNVQVHYLP